MFRTARWRLVLWNVAVLSLILSLIGAVVYALFGHYLYSQVDQDLTNQKAQVFAAIHNAAGDPYVLYQLFTPTSEPSYRVVVADPAGHVNMSTDCRPGPNPFQLTPSGCQVGTDMLKPASQRAIDRVAAGAPQDTRTVEFRDIPVRVLTFQLPAADGSVSAVIQIDRSVVGEEWALHRLGIWLLLGGAFGVVLAWVGSLFLANRALIPIRQAFARQRQFTADASHELRTPLALIRANAEMLERHADRLSAADGELIGEIIQETDHLNRLVSDLLTLARADAETATLQSRPVDFRTLVEGVHGDLNLIAESRGIASTLSLNGPITIAGDEGRLRQLLLILLDNALKYTDPGGRVDVSLEREENRARLVVSDTGIGIPAADLPYIFERFYRVDRAREHESGGTGLGLAIARWIVQAHHGNIKVDSEVGKGTRFQVDLPAG